MPKVIDSFLKEYFFLSNFYQHDLIPDMKWPDIKYHTVEHAFQAAKSLDRSERMRISELATPSDAKFAGRRVNLRQDWEEIKIDVMKHYLREKFSISKLRERLLATEDAILIEGNNWGDTTWGQVNGEGKNYLGKLLMEIREEVKED